MEKLVQYDIALFRLINSISHPLLDPLIYFFSLISELGAVFWIICILVAILDRKNGRAAALWIVISIFISDQVFGHLLKGLWPRERPFMYLEGVKAIGHRWTNGSFPSGHADTVFVLAVILSHYYRKVTVPAYIFAFLTCFSRIYCGMHHPLDVFVGALEGLGTGFLMVLVIKKAGERLLWALPFYLFGFGVIMTRLVLKLPLIYAALVGLCIGGAAACYMAKWYRSRDSQPSQQDSGE